MLAAAGFRSAIIALFASMILTTGVACSQAILSVSDAADSEWKFTVVPAGTPTPTPVPTATVEPTSSEPNIDLDPGFDFSGELSEGRLGITAHLLSNGTVLTVGGRSRGSWNRDPTAEGELLTLGGSEWFKTKSMGYERTFHTGTVLDDGRLLVAGGSGRPVKTTDDEDRSFSSRKTLASSEIYDPRSDEWSEAAEMNVARQLARAVLLKVDGRVMVTGGVSGVESLDGVELYDPKDDVWLIGTPMNEIRRYHTATVLNDGRVLVIGGENKVTAHASAEIYDPISDAWTMVSEMFSPRSGHSASLMKDGRVIVSGGVNTTCKTRWDTCEVIPNDDPGTESDLRSDSILGIGPETTAEIYDPNDDTWTVVSTDLRPRRNHQSATLTDGRVVIVGGEDTYAQNINAVEMYDPVDGSWVIVGVLPDARTLPSLVAMPNGSLLIVGGGTAGGYGGRYTALVLSFTPTD